MNQVGHFYCCVCFLFKSGVLNVVCNYISSKNVPIYSTGQESSSRILKQALSTQRCISVDCRIKYPEKTAFDTAVGL